MSKALNLKIEGMTCGHCASSVTKELAKVAGASEIKVDPIAGTASLMVNDEVANSLIGDAVEEAGYKLVSLNG
jgi:copper chaperone CopZ